ncbi:checkpoint protein Hus1/Mec3 [Mortierella sp. GBAus27b]|nr:checkpoint protein Hus1/Mec3 [Mortierella sp. GBAus27b]
MKLRAKIQRNLLFFKIAQAVEKIGKSCFIKFMPDCVAFGAIHGVCDNDQITTGGSLHCWSRIPVTSLFQDYRVQSKSNDQIFLEIKVEDLLVAMRSCNNASSILMRLTGNSTEPYLTFQITIEDHLGNAQPITQNVPIMRIMSIGDNTAIFEEPSIPEPEVHIMLPREQLRHLVPSYKNIADYIVISANLAGEMTLTSSDGMQHNVQNDMGETMYRESEKAKVETRFTNLTNPVVQDDRAEDDMVEEHPHVIRQRERPREFARVLVRIADLQKVLQSHCVNPSDMICSMVPSHSILFYVYLKDSDHTTLCYFIPEAR